MSRSLAIVVAALSCYGVIQQGESRPNLHRTYNLDGNYSIFATKTAIPYCLDAAYASAAEANAFNAAFSNIQAQLVGGASCVNFRPPVAGNPTCSATPSTSYHIKFTPLIGTTTSKQPYSYAYPGNYTGFNSGSGMIEQVTSIVQGPDTYNTYCSTTPRCIMKYISILLGLRNEHQRPDRDNYITVNPSNVALPAAYDKLTYQVAQGDGTTKNLADWATIPMLLFGSTTNPYYDYCSITHNMPSDFANGTKIAFTLKNGGTLPNLGPQLSYIDCVTINVLYGCASVSAAKAACPQDICYTNYMASTTAPAITSTAAGVTTTTAGMTTTAAGGASTTPAGATTTAAGATTTVAGAMTTAAGATTTAPAATTTPAGATTTASGATTTPSGSTTTAAGATTTAAGATTTVAGATTTAAGATTTAEATTTPAGATTTAAGATTTAAGATTTAAGATTTPAGATTTAAGATTTAAGATTTAPGATTTSAGATTTAAGSITTPAGATTTAAGATTTPAGATTTAAGATTTAAGATTTAAGATTTAAGATTTTAGATTTGAGATTTGAGATTTPAGATTTAAGATTTAAGATTTPAGATTTAAGATTTAAGATTTAAGATTTAAGATTTPAGATTTAAGATTTAAGATTTPAGATTTAAGATTTVAGATTTAAPTTTSPAPTTTAAGATTPAGTTTAGTATTTAATTSTTTAPCASFCASPLAFDEVATLGDGRHFLFKGACAQEVDSFNQILGSPVSTTSILGSSISSVAGGTVWSDQINQVTYVAIGSSKYTCSSGNCLPPATISPPVRKAFEYVRSGANFVYTMDAASASATFMKSPSGTAVAESTVKCITPPGAATSCSGQLITGGWSFAYGIKVTRSTHAVNVIGPSSTPSGFAIQTMTQGTLGDDSSWAFATTDTLDLAVAMGC